MRVNKIRKINQNKHLNQKYSDFELEEILSEINDYKALLNSIGLKVNLKPDVNKIKIKNEKEKKGRGKTKAYKDRNKDNQEEL